MTTIIALETSPSYGFNSSSLVPSLSPGLGFEFVAATVTAQIAVFEPSEVFTVIVAEPFPMAVTTPLELTVATDVLLEVQLTDLFVAFDGKTSAVKVRRGFLRIHGSLP